jgi:hypothetical protein
MIPDFQECWWDSIFLDFGLANMSGMALGHLILVLIGAKWFDWSGHLQDANANGTPVSKNQGIYSWAVFYDPSRLAMIIFGCILLPNVLEVNAFYLLYAFGIPTSNVLMKVRIGLLALLAQSGLAEWYEFVHNPKYTRMGQHTWLALGITVMELLVCTKFGLVEFKNVIPPWTVAGPWLAFVVCFLLWGFFHFRRVEIVPSYYLDMAFCLSFAPLFLLTWFWKFDDNPLGGFWGVNPTGGKI